MADDIIAMGPRSVVVVGFFCLSPSHQHTQQRRWKALLCARGFFFADDERSRVPACALMSQVSGNNGESKSFCRGLLNEPYTFQ